MVVAVALQVEQQGIGEPLVRIPGVMRPHRLVASLGGLPPAQPVVFDIVGLAEHEPADQVMHGQQRQHPQIS